MIVIPVLHLMFGRKESVRPTDYWIPFHRVAEKGGPVGAYFRRLQRRSIAIL
jgi:hypothetical protein